MMKKLAKELWVADPKAMLCRHQESGMSVCFTRNGRQLYAEIASLPHELRRHWEAMQNGHLSLQKTIMEAEEVFIKAYFGFFVDTPSA